MFRFDGERWVPFERKISYTQVYDYYTDDDLIPDLPNVTVQEISLTDVQRKRLEMVRGIEDMGTEPLTKYVMTGELSADYPLMEAKVIKEKTNEALISMVDFAKATPEQILALKPLYKEWSGDGTFYSPGQLVTDDGVIYKVLPPGHTSQPDWTPDKAVSLFAKVLTSPAGPLPWVQPGATNAYMIGDKVTYKGVVWTSKINANVTIPDGDVPYNRYWTDK